jgi:hypothetical protein
VSSCFGPGGSCATVRRGPGASLIVDTTFFRAVLPLRCGG